MNLDPGTIFAAASPPAGGAEIAQIVIATVAASIVTAALLFLGVGHRTGRTQILQRLSDHAERVSGLPGWVSFPSLIATVSLVTAVFGMYWDISLHIDNGRDAGPLANPAHYFILVGLFMAFAAGVLACALPEGRPSRASVKLGKDWYAPVGGLMLLATSSFSLAGFPLDDFWHRIFGQDVTLWGPTHLMMIGGAALGFIGQATLLGEARISERKPEGSGAARDRFAGLLFNLRTT